jgi:hypothetical protein
MAITVTEERLLTSGSAAATSILAGIAIGIVDTTPAPPTTDVAAVTAVVRAAQHCRRLLWWTGGEQECRVEVWGSFAAAAAAVAVVMATRHPHVEAVSIVGAIVATHRKGAGGRARP